MNIHIHPVSLDHASRILKCLESAGRSGCFRGRIFVGAGPRRQYEFRDAVGTVQAQLFPRGSGPGSTVFWKALATLTWTRRVKSCAGRLPVKCINVHGLSTLGLGVALKRQHGCRLVYDTHELETKALAVRGMRRRYSERLERALIRHCDAVVCVSDGIADWYANQYGIPRPLVVRNVPDHRSQVAPNTAENLRMRCGVPPNAMMFLYLGGLAAGRQVERFIEVFARLSLDRHLVFMGRGPLEDLVRRASANHPQVHYHPAVPPNEVLSYTAQADVGLVGVENRCLSYYLSLPNKLFESLAAGLPVIVPDFPEMRRVVDKYQCGWSWPVEGDALATLVTSLSIPEIKAKAQGAVVASRELSWEIEEGNLLKMYRELLSHQTC